MKQTLEEAAQSMAYNKMPNWGGMPDLAKKYFIKGAEWQAKQPQWISAEEPIPEEGQMVFALTQREGIFYIHQETFYRAKYLDGYGKWIHGNSRVLAWMPIPSFDEILEANKDVLERIKEKEVNHG